MRCHATLPDLFHNLLQHRLAQEEVTRQTSRALAGHRKREGMGGVTRAFVELQRRLPDFRFIPAGPGLKGGAGRRLSDELLNATLFRGSYTHD
jgi:hypothetical protein